jgi:DNA-binding protein HU-beta
MSNAVTIKELTTVVAESAGTTKVVAERAIDDLFSEITASLKEGDEVIIRNFGRFYIHTRPARNGRNPKTGESIKIAAKTVIKFSPRGDLK